MLAVAALSVHRLQESGLMLALLSGTGAALVYSLVASRKTAHHLHHRPAGHAATSSNIVSQSS